MGSQVNTDVKCRVEIEEAALHDPVIHACLMYHYEGIWSWNKMQTEMILALKRQKDWYEKRYLKEFERSSCQWLM